MGLNHCWFQAQITGELNRAGTLFPPMFCADFPGPCAVTVGISALQTERCLLGCVRGNTWVGVPTNIDHFSSIKSVTGNS